MTSEPTDSADTSRWHERDCRSCTMSSHEPLTAVEKGAACWLGMYMLKRADGHR